MADIVDTAVAAGSFNTLLPAVQAAGPVGTLKGPARSPCWPRPTRRSPSRWADVTAADIETANGVTHVIDTVPTPA